MLTLRIKVWNLHLFQTTLCGYLLGLLLIPINETWCVGVLCHFYRPCIFLLSWISLTPFCLQNSYIIWIFVHYNTYPGKSVLRWLIIVVSPQRPGFDTWAVYVFVYVWFMVEKLAYEKFFSKIFLFSLSVSFHQCSIKVLYSFTIVRM